MPFTDVSPPEVVSSKTGISFSLSAGKKATVARVSFTAQAQEEIFGGSIAGKSFFAKVGRGADEGLLLIVQQKDGDLEAKSSMHGSASIKMKAWDLLPKDKRPAVQIECLRPEMGGFIFKLPPWAKPSGAGGKLEAEHGIKRTRT